MAFLIYKTGNVFHSNASEAMALASKSCLGEIKSGKVVYSPYEVLYLIDLKKAKLKSGKIKADHSVYLVFRDLRSGGSILKEGLKFGADFRVYSRGDKPGKAHAKYLLYVISGKKIDVLDFAAKARIAHSTNKTLLLAVVDSEGGISYYDVSWKSQ